MRPLRDTITVLFLLIFTSVTFADGLNLRHLAGGVTNSLEIEGNYWYQSVGDRLFVLNKSTGKKVAEIQLSNQRGSAVCTDLMIHNESLWALLDGESVLELSLGSIPSIVSRIKFDELSVIPLQLAIISDWPVVLGAGGVVRLRDRKPIVECDGTVTGVALSLDRGIVYAADRRVYDAGTHEFLGSATLLAELDQKANVDLGTLVFTRDLGNRTEVGLMTPEGRDVDAFQSTVILAGGAGSLTTVGGRVHVCTDEGVYILGVAPRELRLLKTINVEGAKDVGVIGSNYLAICGDQGREIYRLRMDRGGDGDTHLRQVYATATMERGHADRLGISIPTSNGIVHYAYGNALDILQNQTIEVDENPSKLVVLGWSTARDLDTGEMIIRDALGDVVDELGAQNATTVAAISGNFWFGTDNGIIVCGPDAEGEMTLLGSIALAGPIVQLVPQLDGSAAFVSQAGFVGVVSPNYEMALEQ